MEGGKKELGRLPKRVKNTNPNQLKKVLKEGARTGLEGKGVKRKGMVKKGGHSSHGKQSLREYSEP